MSVSSCLSGMDLSDIFPPVNAAAAAMGGDGSAYIDEQLAAISSSVAAAEDTGGARLGSRRVAFEAASAYPRPYIEADSRFAASSRGLHFRGHTNFCSIRANTGVFRGKWMFEALLQTSGVQQIGWATQNCPFTDSNGVGDAPDSFAIDGSRRKLWNVGALPIGEAWVAGDVIGCCIDLDGGSVLFFRNGKAAGEPLNNVHVGPNRCYFPAVSVSREESCVFNFGETPLVYPIEGFAPLQAPPSDKLALADYLLAAFGRVVGRWQQAKMAGETDQGTTIAMTTMAAHCIRRLFPLLGDPYVSAGPLLSFLLSQLLQDDATARLMLIGELLGSLLEEEVLSDVLLLFIDNLCNKCRICTPWRGEPWRYLVIATALLSCRQMKRLWLASGAVATRQLEALFNSRLESPDDVEKAVPDVWWNGRE
jgi:Kip1 ubiquitination-promoting complex protein 1